MARNLQIGEQILVPSSRLPALAECGLPLFKTVVTAVSDRSIRVSLPDGTTSPLLASALVHRPVALLVVSLGDFGSELTLLDPLSKSVLQYFRLLLPDDADVRSFKARSLAELTIWWHANQAAFTHVVFVAHGRKDAVRLAVDGWVDAATLTTALNLCNPAKLFISLACETGCADFGRQFSRFDGCEALIAPFHAVQGAVASQFLQSFLAYFLLAGETRAVAFRHARDTVRGSASFRMWRFGVLKTDGAS